MRVLQSLEMIRVFELRSTAWPVFLSTVITLASLDEAGLSLNCRWYEEMGSFVLQELESYAVSKSSLGPLSTVWPW